MTDIVLFCPRCLGPEIAVERNLIIGAGPDIAECKLCGYSAALSEVLAVVQGRHDKYWTGDRVADALLFGATRCAAGPMLQLLELLGLVPRVEGDVAEQASALEVRGTVIKSVLEAVVTAAFESAAVQSPAHFKRYRPARHEAAERIFSFAEPGHDGTDA